MSVLIRVLILSCLARCNRAVNDENLQVWAISMQLRNFGVWDRYTWKCSLRMRLLKVQSTNNDLTG